MNTRMTRWVGASLLAGAVSASAQTAIVLSDATLKQNPSTRIVEVSYKLTGETPAYITLGIETNGVAIPDPVSVWGDVSSFGHASVVVPGDAAKTIYWQAKKDWAGNLTTNARAVVTAWFTNDPPASVASYVVVDLSAGPTATFYPVRYSITAPDLTTNTCKTTELWLRRIPAGTYTMGALTNEIGREPYALETTHEVALTEEFCIGVFEATQQQWYQVMGTKPSWNTNVTYWASRPVEQVSYCMIREGSGVSTVRADALTWPASDSVGAGSFMDALRQRTGLKFDLPTEAQWEYSCRAGTSGAWNNGTTITNSLTDANLALLGRYTGNNGGTDDSRNLTTSQASATVGSYQPNAWGLYDMHGNVIEWCLDRISNARESTSLGAASVTDPKGYTGTTEYRAGKGGGSRDQAQCCRSGFRSTGIKKISDTHPRFGFRIAIQP